MYPKICKCGKILYSEDDLEDHAIYDTYCKDALFLYIPVLIAQLTDEELQNLMPLGKNKYKLIKAKDITDFDDTNFKN